MRTRTNIRPLVTALSALLLTACGGGSGGSSGPSFIHWSNSANGSNVIALDQANNFEMVQFLSGGDLYYNNTDITNVVVSSATVYVSGSLFGTVQLIPGAGGTPIAAFVCTNGNFAQVYTGVVGCSSTPAP